MEGRAVTCMNALLEGTSVHIPASTPWGAITAGVGMATQERTDTALVSLPNQLIPEFVFF
jgi:hypothetical protein